jgi:hypothetical protein
MRHQYSITAYCLLPNHGQEVFSDGFSQLKSQTIMPPAFLLPLGFSLMLTPLPLLIQSQPLFR